MRNLYQLLQLGGITFQEGSEYIGSAGAPGGGGGGGGATPAAGTLAGEQDKWAQTIYNKPYSALTPQEQAAVDVAVAKYGTVEEPRPGSAKVYSEAELPPGGSFDAAGNYVVSVGDGRAVRYYPVEGGYKSSAPYKEPTARAEGPGATLYRSEQWLQERGARKLPNEDYLLDLGNGQVQRYYRTPQGWRSSGKPESGGGGGAIAAPEFAEALGMTPSVEGSFGGKSLLDKPLDYGGETIRRSGRDVPVLSAQEIMAAGAEPGVQLGEPFGQAPSMYTGLAEDLPITVGGIYEQGGYMPDPTRAALREARPEMASALNPMFQGAYTSGGENVNAGWGFNAGAVIRAAGYAPSGDPAKDTAAALQIMQARDLAEETEGLSYTGRTGRSRSTRDAREEFAEPQVYGAAHGGRGYAGMLDRPITMQSGGTGYVSQTSSTRREDRTAQGPYTGELPEGVEAVPYGFTAPDAGNRTYGTVAGAQEAYAGLPEHHTIIEQQVRGEDAMQPGAGGFRIPGLTSRRFGTEAEAQEYIENWEPRERRSGPSNVERQFTSYLEENPAMAARLQELAFQRARGGYQNMLRIDQDLERIIEQLGRAIGDPEAVRAAIQRRLDPSFAGDVQFYSPTEAFNRGGRGYAGLLDKPITYEHGGSHYAGADYFGMGQPASDWMGRWMRRAEPAEPMHAMRQPMRRALRRAEAAEPMRAMRRYSEPFIGGSLGFADGGDFMTKGPILGVDAMDGDVEFVAGGGAPERIEITPTVPGSGAMLEEAIASSVDQPMMAGQVTKPSRSVIDRYLRSAGKMRAQHRQPYVAA